MNETILGFLVSPLVIIAIAIFLYLVPLVLVIKSERDVSDKVFWFVIVILFSWLGYFAAAIAFASRKTDASEQT
ncbi:hypothetical protein [Alteromonas sp. KUL49]|uniref:hypothetical protein n=1 Tax=Alteromonas sp. KUL49 TaxID=2480798 RepID=UPI00102EE1F9|nr:hypothetical protein [Alteromonas sp. KUL49]TAP39260.1 hypothetical protein EYS00_11995 [Alteromonas sp. KUL49]GEA12040.1 hypothetical protein KUL49_24150 [Alteromonas sp. KUL49]